MTTRFVDRALIVGPLIVALLSGLVGLFFVASAQSEPLALIHDASTTCVDGGQRNACTTGRLDIPKATDLVALCPLSPDCWAGTPTMRRFGNVPPGDMIDGCNNPATPRGAALPIPWTNDPCGVWKTWPASTFAAASIPQGHAQLTWTHIGKDVNGVDTQISKFWLYSAVKGSEFGRLIAFAGASTRSGVIPLPTAAGTYQYYMTAEDIAGIESDPTGTVERIVTVKNGKPSAPASFDIQFIFK